MVRGSPKVRRVAPYVLFALAYAVVFLTVVFGRGDLRPHRGGQQVALAPQAAPASPRPLATEPDQREPVQRQPAQHQPAQHQLARP